MSKWEDEKERAGDCWASLITCSSYSDEDPYSDGRTLNACTCCVSVYVLLWRHRSWGFLGPSFSDFSGSITFIWVVFVVHVNVFTVTDIPQTLILSYFSFFICLNHLVLPSLYYYCIFRVFRVCFSLLWSVCWLSSVKLETSLVLKGSYFENVSKAQWWAKRPCTCSRF